MRPTSYCTPPSRNLDAIIETITNKAWGELVLVDQREGNESIRKAMQQVGNRWKGSLQTITRQKAEERTTEERWIKNLDLIPNHNTETAFAERLLIPLKECGVVKWLLAALHNDEYK